jgi:hypothetical protein
MADKDDNCDDDDKRWLTKMAIMIMMTKNGDYDDDDKQWRL